MQVFIIGTPIETAIHLDKKRLNKQIIECQQILKAICGESKAWVNHPCTIQYREFVQWLYLYKQCLKYYRNGCIKYAEFASIKANEIKPNFHTQEYFDNMKKRLYTKNHEHYKQWENLGESYENWYWVDNKWKIYQQKE